MMKRIQNCKTAAAAATILISSICLSGCQIGSQSPAPAEIIKDPLGIDRAINDYYFPDKKQPKATWGSNAQISKTDD